MTMNGAFTPTPRHRAVDQVTALRLMTQLLRRDVARGELDRTQLAARLDAIERGLNEFAALLPRLATGDPPRD
jgi:hypothetical protein